MRETEKEMLHFSQFFEFFLLICAAAIMKFEISFPSKETYEKDM